MNVKEIMSQAAEDINKEVGEKYTSKVKDVMLKMREAQKLVANLSKELRMIEKKITDEIEGITNLFPTDGAKNANTAVKVKV